MFKLASLLLLSMASSCLTARLNRRSASASAVPVDVLEGQWVSFDCAYDASLDVTYMHELAAVVQFCSQPLQLQFQADSFAKNIAAAVLGKMSAMSEPLKAAVIKGRPVPLLYINAEHPLVSAGLVQISEDNSGVKLIRLRIRADSERTGGLCAVCGQTVSGFGYSTVRNESIRIRKPPVAALIFNPLNPEDADKLTETRLPDGSRRLVLRAGISGSVRCEANGEDLAAVRLLKDGKVLNATSERIALHSIGGRFEEKDVGDYRCEAESSQAFLVGQGQHIGTDSFHLLGPYQPRFELNEVIRYTPVGQQEDIQVKVVAYPPPNPVICTFDNASFNAPEPELLQPYNERDNSVIYLIRLSNSLPGNETRARCATENSFGRAILSVHLTALAPRPEIVSEGATRYHNSYDLRWQHDAGASVDSYRVQIVFRGTDDNATTRQEDFSAASVPSQSGQLTDDRGADKRQSGKVLYGLRADTEHEIRLSSCNQHGCSEFSEPVRVRTQSESVKTFNDPANPVKALLDPNAASIARTVSVQLLSMAILATGSLQLSV